MAAGVAVSGSEVSVITWATRKVPAPASKECHLYPLMVAGGENSGSSMLKMEGAGVSGTPYQSER